MYLAGGGGVSGGASGYGGGGYGGGGGGYGGGGYGGGESFLARFAILSLKYLCQLYASIWLNIWY